MNRCVTGLLAELFILTVKLLLSIKHVQGLRSTDHQYYLQSDIITICCKVWIHKVSVQQGKSSPPNSPSPSATKVKPSRAGECFMGG